MRNYARVWIAAAAVACAGTAATAQEVEFTVRIENVSTAGTLKLSTGGTAPAPTSPGVWAVFKGSNPLFAAGSYDTGKGLESQAEEGNPAMLAASLGKAANVFSSGVFAIPTGESNAGPLLPGKTFEFKFRAAKGQRLALAFMFGQSNDLFYAPAGDGSLAIFDGRGNPLMGDITGKLVLWDAGTEVNQEPGVGADQAPRQVAPNTGATERRKVQLVNDGFIYPPVGSVIRVIVTPNRMAMKQ